MFTTGTAQKSIVDYPFGVSGRLAQPITPRADSVRHIGDQVGLAGRGISTGGEGHLMGAVSE